MASANQSNPHFYPYPLCAPGVTEVVTSGMNPAHFGPTEARALKTLLAKHGISSSTRTTIEDEVGYYYLVDPSGLGGLPASHIFTDDELQDIAGDLIHLNLNDEDGLEFDESVYSAALIIDIIELLHKAVYTGPPGPIADFVTSVTRKGFVVDSVSDPSWSDYCALLKL